MAEEFKRITVKDIAGLDFEQYTVVDLREPDEVITGSIEGSINIPFSAFYSELGRIPKDKPVIVYCRTGEWSEEIADILADRGYDVTNLDGGFQAYKELTGVQGKTKNFSRENIMETVFVDAQNLKCPGPVVKTADSLRNKPAGTKAIVKATEDAFYSDIRAWCEGTGNKLDSIKIENGIITAEITKGVNAGINDKQIRQHEKTFVIFSGDLDKTIAAFIMANGAASMVMPKGSKKLGLSRINMGGMGAKMIRSVMKKNGIHSLEELMEDAVSHGVRLIACQMSMDIMGLHREELIDGVEFGGVTTFLASCEKSDMSLFI